MKTFQTYLEYLNEMAKSLQIKQSYVDNLISNFTMYSKVKEILGWSLNEDSLEKDGELVWQKNGYTLYANPYRKNSEEINFILVSTDAPEFNLKRLVGSNFIQLKYSENYLLDINNYIKSMDKYLKKLNTALIK